MIIFVGFRSFINLRPTKNRTNCCNLVLSMKQAFSLPNKSHLAFLFRVHNPNSKLTR